MDVITQENLREIINREIKLEDDLLGLYLGMLKGDSFLQKLPKDDLMTANEIIDILLRDTARHKETMEKIVKNL